VTKRRSWLWAGSAIGALVVAFALQNHEHVPIRFLFWTVLVPRSLLIVGLFSAGAAAGWLLGSGAWRRRSS
jgi:uncharacterized integral membrane protein